jgi:PAS domain S-box-containing protein/putative nucleotidyltransferase with HDIG domain
MKNKIRELLQSKLILLGVFFILSLGICIFGVVSYQSISSKINADQNYSLSIIANLKKSQIIAWRKERIGDALSIQESGLYAEVFSRYLATGDPAAKTSIIRWLDSIIKNYGYSSAVLLDTQGKVYIVRGMEGEIVGPETQKNIFSAMSSGQVSLSNFHYGSINQIHLDLITPLQQAKAGKLVTVGALLLRIDPDKYLYPLLQAWPAFSETGETLLVSRIGNDVLYLNNLRFQKNAALKLKIPISHSELPAVKAVNGYVGSLDGKDYRGVPVVSYVDKIPDTPWFLIVKVDEKELYAPIRMLWFNSIIIVLLMLLAAGGGLYLFWRKQEANWLQQKLQDVREKEVLLEKYALLSRYANDVILLLDKDFRIIEFNEKAIETYGYSREQFNKMAAVELRIPELQVLPENISQYLSDDKTALYESVHQKADGTSFPVEVSGRKFMKDNETFYQMIIRDITERKKSEKSLQESEALFRAIFESSRDGIVLADEARFIEVNHRGTEILGRSREELIGKTILETAPAYQSDGTSSLEKLKESNEKALSGETLTFEWQAQRGDGTLIDLDLYKSQITIGEKKYIVVVFRDITAKKNSARRLARINECFLNFGADPLENLDLLMQVCGEVFSADMVIFNRYVNDQISVISQWNMPDEYLQGRVIKGLAFQDAMEKTGGEPYLVQNLGKSPYAEADPKIISCGFQTYYGQVIKEEGRNVGVLSLFFKHDFQPGVEEEKLMGIVASAVGTEDQRRIVLEEYHENESLLRNVLESLPVGVWFADKEGRLLLSNQAAEDIWGGSRFVSMDNYSEYKGWWPESGEQVKNTEWPLYRTITSGASVLGEMFFIENFKGEKKTIIVSSVPVRNRKNEMIGAIVVNQDITRLQKVESDLEIQLEHMKALRTIDQMITGSVDMQVNLSLIVREALRQLKADAVDILMYNPAAQRLEYAAGEGFLTVTLQQTRLKMGEGLAGIAALERNLVSIADLNGRPDVFKDSPTFKGEGFCSYHGIPLIAKGQIKGVMEIFHRQSFTPDPDWLDFLEALATQTAIAIDNVLLFENIERSHMELMMAYDSTLEGWSRALDLRDKETEGHTQRVTQLTVKLAEKLGIEGQSLVAVRRGALLHDIGKMGVPDRILLKPGPLTDEEWVIMRKHPVYAFEMLSPIQYLKESIDIPYCHHEKWDGSGYPRGLKGEMIPLSARIFAIVDVWDALSSDRPYRKAWPQEKVLRHIREGAGTHFDPRIVEQFIELIESSAWKM